MGARTPTPTPPGPYDRDPWPGNRPGDENQPHTRAGDRGPTSRFDLQRQLGPFGHIQSGRHPNG